MTSTNDTPLSPGRFVSQMDSREPIEVDCSAWAEDITPEQWSRGKFEAVTDYRPLITVDCSTWGEPTTTTLELTVELAPGADAESVQAKMGRFIESLSEFEKSLGGAGVTWDRERSMVTPGTITLVLVPNEPAGNETRLEALAKVATEIMVEFAPIVRVQSGARSEAA
jgi:hypothetical protein